MMPHRENIWEAVKGGIPNNLPYVPIIDLWHNANSIAGTLPKKYDGLSRDDIAKSEGWALYKVLPDMLF